MSDNSYIPNEKRLYMTDMASYLDVYKLLDVEDDTASSKDVHNNYRVLMYSKTEVEWLEKCIMRHMLDNKLGPFGDAFNIKAALFFPDEYPDTAKKKRGKKPSIYYVEDVAKYLWEKWNKDKLPNDRNNFLTYCYPLIDGVIFKYQRHKHGLSYDEIFQSAIIKLIQAMDKFDPQRVVGTDDKGNPIYARVYTYFTMVLNYGITTITMAHGAEKITNTSYEYLARSLGQEPDTSSNASIIYQEFLIFLDSLIGATNEELTSNDLEVYKILRKMLSTPSGMLQLSVNPVVTIRAGLPQELKLKEIIESLRVLKELFGPVGIFSKATSFVQPDYDQ